MATLTITDLPDEVHTQLKARALKNGQTLEQEIIAQLNRASSRAKTYPPNRGEVVDAAANVD